MEKLIKIFIYFVFLSFPRFIQAQEVEVNRVFDFSGNQDTLKSEIKFLVADSNIIIALGEAQPNGSSSYALTAGFDYHGNVLWQKPLLLPAPYFTEVAGFNNLKKVKPNLYVAGGTVKDSLILPGQTLRHPFLYFFTAAGDSVLYIQLTDTFRSRSLTAICVDEQEHILIGGIERILNSSLPVGQEGLLNYWFAQFDANGNRLQQQGFSVSLAFPLIPNEERFYPEITGVLPFARDSTRFLVSVNNNISKPVPCMNIELSDSLTFLRYMAYGGNMDGGNALLVFKEDWEFNFIAKRNSANFYFMMPATVLTPDGVGYGIYFCKIGYPSYTPIWHQGVMIDTVNLPQVAFPSINRRSNLAEALNGDLIIQRIARRPITGTIPGPPSYLVPALFRVDSNGHTRWAKTFQHVQSPDSTIEQTFNALSVAPDGRLVMGGYLDAAKTVSGIFDSVGRISWLVVVNDSIHDYTTGIGQVETKDVQAQILIYPNPINGNFFIELPDFKGKLPDLHVQICTIAGLVCIEKRITSQKQEFNLFDYPPGVYIVSVFDSKNKIVAQGKLIKK